MLKFVPTFALANGQMHPCEKLKIKDLKIKN